MTANKMPSFNWVELASKLPTALIFIIIVNVTLLKEIVGLYIEQNKTGDTLKVYTLIGIGVIALVNLLIIGSFSLVKLIQENLKTKADVSGVSSNNDGETVTP